MGMFDEILCSATLPGTPPRYVDDETRFQTKDLDSTLSLYEITDDGRLVDTADGSEVAHDGDLEFYTSNMVGCGYGVAFTPDGDDAVSVVYVARFDGGRLVGIEETGRDVSPALPRRELRWLQGDREACEREMAARLAAWQASRVKE